MRSAWSEWVATITRSNDSGSPLRWRISTEVLVAPDRHDRRLQAHLAPEGAGHRLDVARRATRHRRPAGMVAHLEQPVVVEEAGQVLGGEGASLLLRRRPHRRHLGHDEPVDEGARVAAGVEELTERGSLAELLEEASRLAVEAHLLGEHPVEARPNQVRALGEDGVGALARVLEVVVSRADAEAHVGGLLADAEAAQQAAEVGVVGLVEDDEAGVHLVAAALDVDRDGVDVAAGVVTGLEDGDVVVAVEQVGGDQARHPGTDDGDLHTSTYTGGRSPRISAPTVGAVSRAGSAGHPCATIAR